MDTRLVQPQVLCGLDRVKQLTKMTPVVPARRRDDQTWCSSRSNNSLPARHLMSTPVPQVKHLFSLIHNFLRRKSFEHLRVADMATTRSSCRKTASSRRQLFGK
jgi:hypothetical protein